MNKRSIGTAYEKIAEDFLVNQGYHILQKNFYSRHGEIDLIGLDESCLVFIEVKYKRNKRYGSPWEAVNEKKQKHMYYAAKYYMFTHGISGDMPCRFDVVSIEGKTITLFKNAFPIS